MDVVDVPRILATIVVCWRFAEQHLRQYLADYCVNSKEDFITQTFHAQFAAQLKDASEKGYVAQAFYTDLAEALPQVQDIDLRRIATER